MYTFKYGGKRGKTIELKESADKIVVRTKDNKALDDADLGKSSKAVMADTSEVLSFPEAGISVRQVEAGSDKEAVVKRDEARTALKESGDVRFAGRVLEDAQTGEVMLYTENFFIKFKNEVADEACLALFAKHSLVVKMKLPFAEKSWFVEAPEGTGLKTFDIADTVLKEPIVEFCHPEMVQERRSKDLSTELWHLAPTTINGNQVNAHVNILDAWKVTKGKGITIAIVDDGVDIRHPEFAGRVVHPRDVTLNTDDAMPKGDDDNHGTPCAGVAVAAGIKASGTAPEANLMPIRLRSGLGSMAEAMAFGWAADHGADVISCSWGPADGKWFDPEDSTHFHQTFLPDSTRLAIDYAMTKGRNGKGCVVLFAAGNGNEETETDGYVSYPPVIAVAACNDSGRRSVYSDFGKAVWVAFPSRDFGFRPFKHPHPLTPGIFTTDRLGKPGEDEAGGDYYGEFGGTSSACPGAAGVVGLMLAANPDLKPAEVKEILRQSCDKIDTTGGEYDANGHSVFYGYGRINAANAVAMAQKQGKAKPAATEPVKTSVAGELKGFVKFAKSGEVALRSTEAYKQKTGDKFVGIQLKSGVEGLGIKSEVNFSSTGLLTTDQGAALLAKDARGSMIGLGFTLTGPKAAEYALSFEVSGANGVSRKGVSGQFIGTRKTKGTAIQQFSVTVAKK